MHCKHPKGDLVHMLWDCPALKEARLEGDRNICDLNCKHLPPSLLIGLPPAMTARLTDCFWEFDESVADLHPPWWAQLHSRIRPGLQGIELLNSRSANDTQLNARQLLNRLRNTETIDFDSLEAQPFPNHSQPFPIYSNRFYI